jgi:hypothetical protein
MYACCAFGMRVVPVEFRGAAQAIAGTVPIES